CVTCASRFASAFCTAWLATAACSAAAAPRPALPPRPGACGLNGCGIALLFGWNVVMLPGGVAGPVLIVVNPPFPFGMMVVLPVLRTPANPEKRFVTTGAS